MSVKRNILVALLIVLPLLSFATDYYVATKNLNVRTGAGTSYPIHFVLQKGVEVELLSKKGSWYEIGYLGKTGYAHSRHLKYSRTVAHESHINTPRQPDIPLNVFIGVITLVVGLFILKKVYDRKLIRSVTDFNRGTRSERALVLTLLKRGFPASRIFHDLYVEKYRGNFSQIDLVAVTEVGIVVFEVKEYGGWIFGNGNQSQWTKVMAYGREKYSFYNPIMQNNTHIMELKKKLRQYGNIPFHSVIVFYGNCELKNILFVPKGTFLVKSKRIRKVLRTILKENRPVYYENEYEMIAALREAVVNGDDIENQLRHNENIENMLGKGRIFN